MCRYGKIEKIKQGAQKERNWMYKTMKKRKKNSKEQWNKIGNFFLYLFFSSPFYFIQKLVSEVIFYIVVLKLNCCIGSSSLVLKFRMLHVLVKYARVSVGRSSLLSEKGCIVINSQGG